MTSTQTAFPIGTPGVAWGASERADWRAVQKKLRSFADDVWPIGQRLEAKCEGLSYGTLDFGPDERYPQPARRSGA